MEGIQKVVRNYQNVIRDVYLHNSGVDPRT